jgi:serine protease Do
MRVRNYLLALAVPYAVLGAVAFTSFNAGAAGKSAVAAAPALPTPAPAPPPSHDGFADVVAHVRPAIVSIMATKTGERQLYGFGSLGGRDGGQAPIERGIGSGIITSADGYILTNNHVVDGATSLRVRLVDGRELTGKVVGADSHTDVAVVKVDAKDLPAVQFADSSKLAVGQYALAIGAPFGLESTVTLGIVSATERGSLGITDYEDFIQTDAAINPGNSGGALVDADGKVIGMSTAIIGGQRGNVGIGLAVPANLARAVMQQLVAHGKVERGFLGAGIQDVTPDLAAAMGRSAGGGALVGDLVSGGPPRRQA